MRFIFIVTAVAIAGCATTTEPRSAYETALKLKEFEDGTISLDCGLRCAGTFGFNRAELKLLHDSGLWTEVATKVISIGYNEDLAWYYLARSAEELGHVTAAGHYYAIARASTMRCASWPNTCDGIDVQIAASERIKALSRKPSPAKEGGITFLRPADMTDVSEPDQASVQPVSAALARDTEPPVETREPETDSGAREYEDWRSDRSMILTFASVQIPRQDEAARLAISYDGHRVRLSGLYSKDYYMQSFTQSPPVFAAMDGTPYVAYPWFFEQAAPTTIRVGDVKIRLVWDGAPHWVASEADTAKLVQAFAKGLVAEVGYSASQAGKAGHFESSVPLAGFRSALTAFHDTNEPMSASGHAQDPLDLIAPHLTGNQFEISRDDLRQKDNPNGEGYFVYVPETRFNGTERLFIWFANRGHVTKINGATDNLTPELPFPREAQYDIWNGSGLTHDTLTEVGLDTAFSR